MVLLKRSTRLFLLLLLAACTVKPATWQKANISPDEQRADMAQCRSYARKEAEKDYQSDRNYSTGGSQSTYQQNMDAYSVKKNTSGLFTRCMKLKGYYQVRN